MSNFRKVVKLLKRQFPEYVVKVRRLRLPTTLQGDCSFKEPAFLIRINNVLNEDAAIDVLIHEWAHILSWDYPGDNHGMQWGKAYSRVYRLFLREFVESN